MTDKSAPDNNRLLRHPDPAVVTQGLGHQSQLRLRFSVLGNTGRVNLRVAGIGEESASAVCAPDCRTVAPHRVRGKEEYVSVSPGCQNNGIRNMRLYLAGNHIPGDNSPGAAVNNDQVDHLMPAVELNGPRLRLAHQCLVGTDKQLLPGLPAGIESSRHLHAAERAVVQQAAVFTRKGNTLCHALIDNCRGNFGQTVHVRFARTEIPAFDGVVEQAEHGIVVVLVVLRRVDSALRGN